jgi:hypothetical protein
VGAPEGVFGVILGLFTSDWRSLTRASAASNLGREIPRSWLDDRLRRSPSGMAIKWTAWTMRGSPCTGPGRSLAVAARGADDLCRPSGWYLIGAWWGILGRIGTPSRIDPARSEG